jgi:hypothetical protein
VDDIGSFVGRVIEVFSGVGVFIALFTLAAKWQQRPQLLVRLDSNVKRRHSTGTDAKGPFRFAHVIVQNTPNTPIPGVFKLLTYRQPARRVRLKLEYFAVDGTYPKFSFDARWSENLAPVRTLRIDGAERVEFDAYRTHTGRYLDISSGEYSEPVAVALKQQGDKDCFGFTNERYEGGVARRRPEWRLPLGSHKIIATAVAGDVQSEPTEFILHNDGPDPTDLWIDQPSARRRRPVGR